MSAETASISAGAIGSVAPEAVGSSIASASEFNGQRPLESITSIGSIGPHVESIGAYTPTILQAPEIPTSIITEIQKPATLTDAEFLPPKLIGDFSIHDIVPQSEVVTRETKISEPITIEPAVITSEPVPNTRPLHETTIPATIPFSLGEEVKIPGLETVTNPAQKTAKAESAPGSIATGIFTLGAVESETEIETETQLNEAALKEAILYMDSLAFTAEETAIWKQKLQQAIEKEDVLEALEVKTATQAAVQTQTQTEPTEIEQPVRVEDLEALWDLYLIQHTIWITEEIDEQQNTKKETIDDEKTEVTYEGRFKESQLSSEIQKLAAHGAENIIWKNGRYQPTDKLNFTEPEELTKTA